MSSYVKISYKTKTENSALKECIEYIGKYYGNNRYNNLYKSGKVFLAKKVRGASRISVNNMVYSNEIKNSEMRQWKFKKHSYERTYRYIIYILLHRDGIKEEALSLLRNLYLELKKTNNGISKILSDILVLEQKNILLFAIDKPQYKQDQDTIKRILTGYDDCDEIYYSYLV